MDLQINVGRACQRSMCRMLLTIFLMLTLSACKEEKSPYNSGDVYDNNAFAELTAKKQVEQEPKNINIAKLKMAQVDIPVPNSALAKDLPVPRQAQ